MFFHQRLRESELASDGFEKTWNPPHPFNQRLWAGSQLTFDIQNPLKIGLKIKYPIKSDSINEGQRVKQQTSAKRIDLKKGSRGDLIFVTEERLVSTDVGLSVKELRTLAYMNEKPDFSFKSQPLQPVPSPEFTRTISLNPVTLFRYSAVTFNSHRIHYDWKYVQEVEGYPGLLVHGPLSSTLLLDLFKRTFPSTTIKSWNYRALKPIFVENEIQLTLNGRLKKEKEYELWITDDEGSVTMTGLVEVL